MAVPVVLKLHTVLVVLKLHTVLVVLYLYVPVRTEEPFDHDDTVVITAPVASKRNIIIIIMVMINWREYRNITRMRETVTQ